MNRMTPSESHATVDHRAGELIVCSYSQTTAGFWIMNGAVDRLPDEVDDDQLGTAIITALDSSEHGVPLSPGTGTPFSPVLRALGIRSYGRYMTGTAQVAVSRTAEGVLVTPKHNGGTREGFTEIEARG
jgi:hypothetical protein